DAPSGTAFLLGEAAAAGRGVDLHTRSARGRDGHTGARRPGDIGFASLRGGSVTGDHSVIFAGPMERIELTHRAEDRTMFEQGVAEAREAGRKLKAQGLSFDIAFTSVLTRAQHTLDLTLAEIGQTGLPTKKDLALNERDYGDLSGLNKDDARKKWGEDQVLI